MFNGFRIAAARLTFAPFEFGAEDPEEAVRAAAKETDAGVGAVAVDVVAEAKRDCDLAVDGEEYLVGDADNVDADGGFAWRNDGANGEQMRADWGDQHG